MQIFYCTLIEKTKVLLTQAISHVILFCSVTLGSRAPCAKARASAPCAAALGGRPATFMSSSVCE